MSGEEGELGKCVKLSSEDLPTKIEVFQHFNYLNSETVKWTNKIFSEKAKFVRDEVARIWEKAGIPHDLRGKWGVRKVTKLLNECKQLTKYPVKKRGGRWAEKAIKLKAFFEAAICTHLLESDCSCSSHDKVPRSMREYLRDQRGPRRQVGALSRVLSLRINNKK